MSDRPATAGYSGKSLSQKLGLKADQRVFLHQVPQDYPQWLDFDLGCCRVLKRVGEFDFGHAFVRSRVELAQALDKLDPHLHDRGMLWISWPKKASRIPCDITEDTLRELALPRGLVDTKVCAVDAVWSGLKLMRRVSERR